MKKKVLLITITAVAGILLLSKGQNTGRSNDLINEEIQVTGPSAAILTSTHSVKGSLQTSNPSSNVRKSAGRTITKASTGNGPGEVGVTEEGGGIGPTSFKVSKTGEVLVLDRMNDRILAGTDGAFNTVVDLQGKFLKGMAIDDDNDIRVLTGNDTLVLERYSLNGEKLEGVNPSFKPVHLNGMDVRKVGNELLISGAVENYSVNSEGTINEVPGIPLIDGAQGDSAKYMDSSMSVEGDAVVLTFRDELSAPLREKRIQGDFGGILGTFPTKKGNIVLAVESMGNSAAISFITVDSSGEVIDHLEVEDKGEFLVDQKTQVSADGCKAFQMSAGRDSVEVIEYDLKCM